MRQEILDKLSPITQEEQRILDGSNKIDAYIYVDGPWGKINSKKLLEDGHLITIRPHTRFIHFPEHTHDYVEVVYMCKGKTTHIVDGNTIELNVGELLFLTPNARQEILPAGRNDIAVNFIILPSFFKDTLNVIGHENTPLHSFLTDVLSGKKGETNYLHFAVSDVLPIQNLVENLLYTLLYGAPNKRNINQYTMGLLFLNLINNVDKISDKNDNTVVLKVLTYIEKNYKNGSLYELADELHYEYTWLSREISEKMGKSYTDLMQEKKLAQAKYLLKNTKTNISDIANEVGYDNISYFHRLFKCKFGVSPKKYRDICK